MQIPTAYEGLCTNIIIDGKIIEEHLQSINKDSIWLQTQLNSHGIVSPLTVLLAYVDTAGTLHIHLKNSNK